MNDIERRVSEGLRAYGEELTMTTQDVDRLESQADTARTFARHDRNRRIWQGAVAACAVTGVVLGALALRSGADRTPTPIGPAPVTLAQLEGIWRVDGSDWLWRFAADGKVTQSNRADLLTGVGTQVAYSVRPAPGGFVVFDVSEAGSKPGCEITNAATISAEGRLRFSETSSSAACGSSTGGGPADVWSMTRVSPVSVAGAAATSNLPSRMPYALTSENSDAMVGSWLLRGTGTLLTVAKNTYPEDGFTYALQDLGSTDTPETGTLRVRTGPAPGEVTFSPTGGNEPCPRRYESVVTHYNMLTATLKATACNQQFSSSETDIWIRLN